MFREHSALVKHGIHQSRLAVIDVRNDGDITNRGLFLVHS